MWAHLDALRNSFLASFCHVELGPTEPPFEKPRVAPHTLRAVSDSTITVVLFALRLGTVAVEFRHIKLITGTWGV